MRESLLRRLRELTALDGVSGFEQPVVRYLRDAFADLADEVTVDTMGNLYALRRGPADGPRLVVEAHSDEIGAIVKSVDPQGFLRFDVLGGAIPSMLVGRRVRVRGHLGVIGVRSGHLQHPDERQRVPATDDLYIDVGAESAEAVAEMGLGIGDPVAYESPLLVYTSGNRVCGKAIDNRIGCAVLVELFQQLKGVPLDGTVQAVVAVQEETGLRGAQVAGYRVDADYAIVVDTFMAGDTPDVEFYRELPAAIGGGPVLLLAHRAHIGHPAVNGYLREAAERVGVRVQPCTIVGRAATDSGTLHLAKGGIPTAGLGLPRRYSHTPVCTLDLRDAVGAVEILLQFARDMPHHTDLTFLGDHG